MKYIINNLVFLWLIMCTFSYSITKAQMVSLDANYNLVFDENFSDTVLDVSKWNTSYPWGQMSNDGTFSCNGNVSWDIAGYSLDPTDTNNVKVNNGSVKLVGTKEIYKSPIMTWPTCPSTICTTNNAPCGVNAKPNNCFVWDTTTFNYRNGILFSTHKFLYGYFEMKWRLPNWTASTNNVFTPTFWLFGSDSTAKWSEIDIFEIKGTNGLYGSNVHVIGGNNPSDTVPTSDFNSISSTTTIDLATWHTSSVLWTPDSIVFYLDSVSIDVTRRDTNKYLIPMQIIVENGLPALNFCLDSINSSTPLPVTYELDYVKVWQPAMACDTNKTYLTGTPTNYVSKHYQSLTLGGSGGNFVFNSSNGLGYGVDYVLLDAGTEISGTGIFQADVLPCWEKMPVFNQSVSNPTPMPPNYLKMFKHAHSNY